MTYKKKEQSKKQIIRYVLIFICIGAVIGAFYLQNSLLLQLTGNEENKQSEQVPVADTYLEPNSNVTKVVLTKMKDKKPYIVLYEVNKSDFKFTAKAYKVLKEPISSARFQSNGSVWILQNSKWKKLNDQLEVVSSTKTMPEFNQTDTYSIEVLNETNNPYQVKLLKDKKEVWIREFTSRPEVILPLSSEQAEWMVLFEDFEIKIIKN